MAKALDYQEHRTWPAAPELGWGQHAHREAAGMDLSDFLFVLRTRLWWIAASTLAGILASIAITLGMTPVYTAKSTLFVSVNSSQDTAYARGQFALQRVGSYPQLVNDPQLINQVIRELDLDRSFQDVKSNVNATNPVDTVLLAVTAKAPEAQQAADIANTAAGLLAESIQKLENTDPKKLEVKAELSVPAAAPQYATAPRKSVNLALGLVSGASLGLLLALALHKLDPRILRGRDAERQLRMRVLGTVAARSKDGARANPTGIQVGYRQLVSNLLMANDGRLPQRILVLSTRADAVLDGQQLAQTLAAMGKRSVIVQADRQLEPLRRDEASGTGLAQVLAGTSELHDALTHIESVPMGYLPAGPQPETLRRFDVFAGLDSLIASLEEDFDVVIFVASMEGQPVDATAVALHSDCVILTGRERRTTYRQVADALQELNAVRVGATGLVLVRKPSRFRHRRGT
ncbi:hypothetical protein CQ016_10895 [Arthrobacter sp. MYb222]|nr:hypothetical protein CQ016_10895 [Arthrobacter sp. MYb222]